MTDKKFLLKLFAIVSALLYEALAGIAIGYFIGLFIDNRLDLTWVFTIIFMVIGALAALRNFMVRVYRLGVRKDAN
nr:MAG: AtpZ/AtpI family protein [Acholeplasmatales bacterium]